MKIDIFLYFFTNKKRKSGEKVVYLIIEGLERRNIINITLDENYFQKLDKTLNFIPLTYDYAFKSVFASNLDILKEFLKAIIPFEINDNSKVRILNSELLKTNKKERKNICDIFVVIDEKVYVDIELNRSRYKNVKQRNNLYMSKLYSLLLESGKNINDLKEIKLYQININAYEYENKYLNEKVILYAKKAKEQFSENEYILIKSIAYFRKLYYNEHKKDKETVWLTALTSKSYNELYGLMKQVLKEEKLKKFMEGVVRMNIDEFSLHEWEKEKLDALVRYNELEDAKEEGLKKVAKNMFNMKIDIKDIAKATGLNIKTLKSLAKEC